MKRLAQNVSASFFRGLWEGYFTLNSASANCGIGIER